MAVCASPFHLLAKHRESITGFRRGETAKGRETNLHLEKSSEFPRPFFLFFPLVSEKSSNSGVFRGASVLVSYFTLCYYLLYFICLQLLLARVVLLFFVWQSSVKKREVRMVLFAWFCKIQWHVCVNIPGRNVKF